ncbi:Putative NADP-dependent oxidoreductase domain-containing protein [Septoria linicola]|uniref:NADP-dependent oxidoreductase domain-containing protein n=1 Tax=Septoria linicola TaxID=215465 RepID=A0A9Q9AZI1_9PEZI|nr:putative NADP-dependent oxidoreductase domain-containing protein [Septoria linicola]USW54732.1 Putative NADP-dependent oxidoreductase domain-containing protein [Septoria linicola]
MAFFQPPPKPKSALGYHRVLSPSAGIKGSPLCLGTMNMGEGWKDFMGECDKDTSFALLDKFFVLVVISWILPMPTNARHPKNGWESGWKREIIATRCVATKYATGYLSHRREEFPIQSNYVGNSIKSLNLSVEASLKKLRRSYMNLLYVHWWDFTTSVEEVMQGLHVLIMAGKVLYLGVSDTPAWVVVKANEYARAHGLRPKVAGMLVLERSSGISIAPWAPLGQGRLKTAEARSGEHAGAARAAQMSEDEIKVSDALEKMATTKGASLHAVALAYLMHKTPHVFPIVGQRSVRHLGSQCRGSQSPMSVEEVHKIDDAMDFDAGFPMNFIFRGTTYRTDLTAADDSPTGLEDVAGYAKSSDGMKLVAFALSQKPTCTEQAIPTPAEVLCYDLLTQFSQTSIVEELIRIFFDNGDWYFGLLERHYFQEWFSVWRERSARGDAIHTTTYAREHLQFSALLFLTLAAAVQFVSPDISVAKLLAVLDAASRDQWSEKFGENGSQILEACSRHEPSLYTVQAALLQAFWLKTRAGERTHGTR